LASALHTDASKDTPFFSRDVLTRGDSSKSFAWSFDEENHEPNMPGGGDSDRVGALPRACSLFGRGPGDPAPPDLSVLMLLKIEGFYGLGFGLSRAWFQNDFGNGIRALFPLREVLINSRYSDIGAVRGWVSSHLFFLTSFPEMTPFWADTRPFLGVGDLPLSFIAALSD